MQSARACCTRERGGNGGDVVNLFLGLPRAKAVPVECPLPSREDVVAYLKRELAFTQSRFPEWWKESRSLDMAEITVILKELGE